MLSEIKIYIYLSSTNKTDHHDITEILLKVAWNTINHNHYSVWFKCSLFWLMVISKLLYIYIYIYISISNIGKASVIPEKTTNFVKDHPMLIMNFEVFRKKIQCKRNNIYILYHCINIGWIRFMVFSATFNNISVIS
jgi:hypothetical protein